MDKSCIYDIVCVGILLTNGNIKVLYVSLCSSYIKNELKKTIKELRKYRFEFTPLDRKPDDWRCFYDNAVKSDSSFHPARNILYSSL